ERDELLVRHHRDRQGAAAFARQHRQRRAGRRLARQRRDEAGEDDEWKRDREKWQRTSVQWRSRSLLYWGRGDGVWMEWGRRPLRPQTRQLRIRRPAAKPRIRNTRKSSRNRPARNF